MTKEEVRRIMQDKIESVLSHPWIVRLTPEEKAVLRSLQAATSSGTSTDEAFLDSLAARAVVRHDEPEDQEDQAGHSSGPAWPGSGTKQERT